MWDSEPDTQIKWHFADYYFFLYGTLAALNMMMRARSMMRTNSMKQSPLEDNVVFSQLIKNFKTLYGTQRFITTFTTGHHLSSSSDRLIQSTHTHLIPSISILILSSYHKCLLVSSLQVLPLQFCMHFSSCPMPAPVNIASCNAVLYEIEYKDKLHLAGVIHESLCKDPTVEEIPETWRMKGFLLMALNANWLHITKKTCIYMAF